MTSIIAGDFATISFGLIRILDLPYLAVSSMEAPYTIVVKEVPFF
jgi:hypothetical protein